MPTIGVDNVLITAELASRPSPRPKYEAESRALGMLAEEMATNPRGVIQKCAELVMELCHADSAGISILESGGTSGMLRWHAAAGAFAANLHGTMPREASPCGTVIERNSVLLFKEAERVFPALRDVEPRIYENLLAPWHAKGEAVGTIWAIKHAPEGRFDAEDARVLQSLARFAAAAFQMTAALDEAVAERSALRQSEEQQTFLLQLTDAIRSLENASEIQVTTTRLLGEHLGVDRSMYGEVEGDRGAEVGTIRGQYVRAAAEGEVATVPFPEHFSFKQFGAHIMAARYRGETLVVRDVEADPAFDAAERAAWVAAGVRAAIVATLVKAGRLVAEFGVHSAEPRAWSDAEITLVREVAERTWAAAERARAEAALRESERLRRVLVGELQHRTRNLIGLIRSTADKTARTSHDIADFRTRLRARLDAMARVQGLLSRLKDTDRVVFEELIETEVAAMHGGADRVRLDGPKGVRLRSSTVQTLAMALHELATNAVKYGAIGQPQGRLAVTWSFERSGPGGKPWLHIDWRESEVAMPPPGAAPQGSGQGRELIERALPYQLQARTTYELGPDGVHCTISIPVSESSGRSEVSDG